VSGSKLDEDTVDRVEVLTFKLAAQFSEQSRLFVGEKLTIMALAVEIKSISYSDSAAMTSTDSLNWV